MKKLKRWCTLLLLAVLSSSGRREIEKSNPYYQDLPDCGKGYDPITKKTNLKGILCPMIKDEEGFLSEWLAYYQVHGFDHVMLFDDGSQDEFYEEIKPWLEVGFVSVRSNWTEESLKARDFARRGDFLRTMGVKSLLERECRLQAIEWGYHYFVSLDLDEYLVPLKPHITAIDALHSWFHDTGRSIYCISKLNFQSSPHILEPVNLLTIEAFQTRMTRPSKMSYYTTVANKCAYHLNPPTQTKHTKEFIASCCFFHGCNKEDLRSDSNICREHFDQEMGPLLGKGKPYHHYLDINHYSRSMEKYTIKAKTWRTATGEATGGLSTQQAARTYDMPKFMARSVGGMTDRSILRYTCQVREQLKKMTGQAPYLRPGTGWYRNPEFGKEVTDPEKRGRYGRPSPPGFKFHDPNLYHYHGGDVMGENTTLISPQGEKMPWSEWNRNASKPKNP